MTPAAATHKGFSLKRLSLTGPNVPKAEITFDKGLNVVVGPSDTGKTFIAQCIDFMLGAGTPPKSIPEAQGYDTAHLEVETSGGERLILQRSLFGGAFRLSRGNKTLVLKEVHDSESEKTVSHLLLSLAGFSDQRLRTNARGATRTISFRDIAHLILVGEKDVIRENSPIFTGQNITITSETSLFRMLLTGHDDSSLIEQEDQKVTRSKREGKRELLEELLSNTEREIQKRSIGGITPENIDRELRRTEAAIEELNETLTAERASAFNLESDRKSAWQKLRRVESRAGVSRELQSRFLLLQKQYASDLRRLEAITEAGVRLAQMTEERCPVCGAVAQHHDEQHRLANMRPQNVAEACRAEAVKLQPLMRDLSVTISHNTHELSNLEATARAFRAQLQDAQHILQEEMQPRIATLVDKLRDLGEYRERLANLTELFRRQSGLLSMQKEANRPIPRPAKLPSVSVGSDEAEKFSQVAERLLRTWNFPRLERVTFSEEDQDLVISGRKRSSHGKGVRALTHAAFSLALLKYCRESDRPHPGLVVVDSPLVVYRAPDNEEQGEEYKVKDAFYLSVAAAFSSDQVIVLENELPPSELTDANIVSFTGAKHGRAGFLPEGFQDTKPQIPPQP